MLLNVPPPEVIDHAADVALPPIDAPLNTIAVGDADWHITFGPPPFTVGEGVTDIVTLPVMV